jgi:hypothetical protein
VTNSLQSVQMFWTIREFKCNSAHPASTNRYQVVLEPEMLCIAHIFCDMQWIGSR